MPGSPEAARARRGGRGRSVRVGRALARDALNSRRGGLAASRRPSGLRRPEATAQRAGAGAGAVGVLAGQPLDVVRVRLQQPRSGQLGALASLRAVVAAEGAGALFRGSFYPLTTIALQARAPASAGLARPRRAVPRPAFSWSGQHRTLPHRHYTDRPDVSHFLQHLRRTQPGSVWCGTLHTRCGRRHAWPALS